MQPTEPISGGDAGLRSLGLLRTGVMDLFYHLVLSFLEIAGKIPFGMEYLKCLGWKSLVTVATSRPSMSCQLNPQLWSALHHSASGGFP